MYPEKYTLSQHSDWQNSREHMFEMKDGSKDEWRVMVLALCPIINTWFYITYEKDSVLYMYQLLDG